MLVSNPTGRCCAATTNRLPGDQGTQTNYQLSFTGEPPFVEYPVGQMQQKAVRMEDVEKLAEEMMAAQHRK